MVNTLKKGNKLEDSFYDYLLAQKNRGDLVYGAYPPELCQIFKKKKYYCREREADIQFDVVIELYRKGSSEIHLAVVFECKNHDGNISEIYINDFSSKLSRIFKHAGKGVIVTPSRLQSGAANVAKKSKIGIVKYDKNGIDVIADRKSGSCVERRFVEKQFFRDENSIKSLKFSAYYDGRFFGSIDHLLKYFDSSLPDNDKNTNDEINISIPFISDEEIQRSAQIILEKIDYKAGRVDLANICSMLTIDLEYSDQVVQDGDGNLILGSANFDRKSILVNFHDNKYRERFTIAHEIGHFCLQHDRYLHSETIVERDLLITSENGNRFNYERLEFQANAFASHLLLPKEVFEQIVAEYRTKFDIRDRGHGYIFVDDQPCNYGPYSVFLSELSTYFEVSMQATEIKLKTMGMLVDQRSTPNRLSTPKVAENSTSLFRC